MKKHRITAALALALVLITAYALTGCGSSSTPAEEAGLLPGDLIRSMDGESCVGMSLAEIAAYVRQGGKESVQLGIEREGEEDLLMLTVSIRSIDLHMVEHSLSQELSTK